MRRAICGRVQTRIGARGQLRWELATSPTRPRNGRRFSGEHPDVLFGELVGDAMHDCRPDHYANEQVSGGIPPLTAALGTRRRCSPECSQPGGPGEHPHGCAGRPPRRHRLTVIIAVERSACGHPRPPRSPIHERTDPALFGAQEPPSCSRCPTHADWSCYRPLWNRVLRRDGLRGVDHPAFAISAMKAGWRHSRPPVERVLIRILMGVSACVGPSLLIVGITDL